MLDIQTELSRRISSHLKYGSTTRIKQRNRNDTADRTAGDVTQDSQNQYVYDGEGRICAVHNMLMGWTTGYVYNAEGVRVAKGTLNWTGSGQPNWNTACSGQTGQNGWSMTITTSYILGPSNEQLTEMTWSGGSVQWAHTNVFAGGQLTATYTPVPNPSSSTQSVLNYHFADWLGTRRVLTDQNGVVQQACTSLPYGNGESCSPTPTEHLFTGKERDQESGNDYFGARYFASTMGRFLSPDPSGIASVDPSNPQSWNFYSYARNNPFVFVDPTGLDPCQGSGPSENDESGMTSHDDDGGGGWSCATDNSSVFGDIPPVPPYPPLPPQGTPSDKKPITIPPENVYACDDSCKMSDAMCELEYPYLVAQIGLPALPSAPNNASVRATPPPPKQNWWKNYWAQLGCEMNETVNQGEEIVTAYGLSILARGGGAYKTSAAFFTAGAAIQVGIRENCVHEAWGADHF